MPHMNKKLVFQFVSFVGTVQIPRFDIEVVQARLVGTSPGRWRLDVCNTLLRPQMFLYASE
jgi:hypothetical protein